MVLYASDLSVSINWNMGQSWNLECVLISELLGSVPYITCARTLGCVFFCFVFLLWGGRGEGGEGGEKEGEETREGEERREEGRENGGGEEGKKRQVGGGGRGGGGEREGEKGEEGTQDWVLFCPRMPLIKTVMRLFTAASNYSQLWLCSIDYNSH